LAFDSVVRDGWNRTRFAQMGHAKIALHLRGREIRLLVEASILLASLSGNPTTLLLDAATTYKVSTDPIALKVKHEFAAKANAKKEAPPVPKAKKLPTTAETERRQTCRLFVSSNLQNRGDNPLWFLPAPSSRFVTGPVRRLRARTTFRDWRTSP